MIKKIIILGSTGSIGRMTLEVARENKQLFKIVGLSAGSNTALLREQIKEFKPEAVALFDEKKKFNPSNIELYRGLSGINELVKKVPADLVVVAVSGSSILLPLLSCIRAKRDIALANKEALVMAGHIIIEEVKKNHVNLIPIDSEQSAIFQCLKSERGVLKKIYLTASGGPFYKFNKDRLKNITISQALRHPRWNMGKKISVDSATLMNKGLEIIEAMHLFNISPRQIEILIHPEVIIHSMVEFIDGVVLAEMSNPDMKFPISYALSFPKRLKNNFKPLNFLQIKRLNFIKPELNKFPCLKIAYEAAFKGGSLCAVLNAANEELVKLFLAGKIKFLDIPNALEKILSKHKQIKNPNITEILSTDTWARDEVMKHITK